MDTEEDELTEEAEDPGRNTLLERFNMVSQEEPALVSKEIHVDSIEHPEEAFAISSEMLQKQEDEEDKKEVIVSNLNTENTN